MTDAPSSLRSTAIRGVAWTTLDSMGSRLITAGVFVVLVRLLEPSDVGIVALALVFVSLTSLLVEQGLGAALVQREHLTKGHLDTAFWFTSAVGLTLATTLFLVAGPLSRLLDASTLEPVLQALSLTLVFGAAASAPTAVLERDLGFRKLAYRKLMSSLLGGIAGVTAALLGYGVWALVVQILVATFTKSAMLWIVTPYRPGLAVSRASLRDLYAFSSRMFAIRLLGFISKRADDLLIGTVLGAGALGLYAVAYRLLLIMSEVLTTTINSVAFPTFSKLQGDLGRVRAAYQAAVVTTLTVSAPAFLGVVVLAPEIIAVCFGAEWADSAPVMRLLALAGLVEALLSSTNPLLLALGRAKTALRLSVLVGACNVIGFAIGVQFGIVAVALAYAVRAYLLAPLPIIAVRRVLGLSLTDWARPLVAPAVSAVGMAGVVYLAQQTALDDMGPAGRLALGAALGAVVYVGALRLLGPQQFRELVSLVVTALPPLRRLADRRRSNAE